MNTFFWEVIGCQITNGEENTCLAKYRFNQVWSSLLLLLKFDSESISRLRIERTRKHYARTRRQTQGDTKPNIMTDSGKPPGGDNNGYYRDGSSMVSEVSAVNLRKLETRRQLTQNPDRLVICLVGLPGRGKSFISRKLQTFLKWRGTACEVFNVGKYRRQAQADVLAASQEGICEEACNNSNPDNGNKDNRDNNDNNDDAEMEGDRRKVGACDANFFDRNNPLANQLRARAAQMAMDDMITWLEQDSRTSSPRRRRKLGPRRQSGLKASVCKAKVAIFDATNSTAHRRKWVLETLSSLPGTGVVFVESVCDDAEMLEENFRFKVQNSPDFAGMTTQEAIEDLRKRVQKYEEQYETIDDDTQSYIKIFNLSSKLLVNHIYGRMAKVVVPCLMSWNIGCRPIYLCRAGDTESTHTRNFHTNNPTSPRRGVMLNDAGMSFRDALAKFIETEGYQFASKSASALKEAFTPSVVNTGTSVSGLAEDVGNTSLPFACHVMTSTMPRAVETATWDNLPCEVKEFTNLNPLDKGDFSGMEIEEIKERDPNWYELLEDDPFATRFPGGECYADLIQRVETCIIDMEQQVNMVCVVSHISVLQVLMAYFQRTPIERCSSIRVPMHTVIKFTPATGGGWRESQHHLGPKVGVEKPISFESEEEEGPIWGDHLKVRKILTTSSGNSAPDYY